MIAKVKPKESDLRMKVKLQFIRAMRAKVKPKKSNMRMKKKLQKSIARAMRVKVKPYGNEFTGNKNESETEETEFRSNETENETEFNSHLRPICFLQLCKLCSPIRPQRRLYRRAAR